MALLIVKLNGDRFSPSSVCVFIVISGGLFLAFLFFLFFFFVPTRIYIQLHRDKKKKSPVVQHKSQKNLKQMA